MISNGKPGPRHYDSVTGSPPIELKFIAMNLLVSLLPTGWKFLGNSILLKTRVGESAPVSLPEPYTWTWAGPEEIDFLARHPEATSRSAYARRAARGDRCLCIKRDTEIVGYRWFKLDTGCVLCGFGPKREIIPFSLKPGQAYSFDLFTYQKHRGRGVATMLMRLLLQFLREDGVKEVFSLVAPTNHASLRLQTRFGAEPQRMVYNYRIRGWSRTFLGPEGDPRLTDWMRQFISAPGGRNPC